MKIVAVLSTPVLPVDGTSRVKPRTEPEEVRNILGVPHYVGHPATKSIVEGLGAVPAPSKLFTGLNVGESAVAFPIAQGKSKRATEGVTTPNQAVTIEDLSIRVVTRVE